MQHDMRRRPCLPPLRTVKSYCGRMDKFGFAFDRMGGGRDGRTGWHSLYIHEQCGWREKSLVSFVYVCVCVCVCVCSPRKEGMYAQEPAKEEG